MLLPSALLSSFLFTLVAAASNKKIRLESQTSEARAENDREAKVLPPTAYKSYVCSSEILHRV